MYKNDILNKLTTITHQPFLIFASRMEEKTDNTFETLCLLSKENQVTAGRISEYLDIKPSSVTQIIKKLETNEMIERIKSETDARVTFVTLTEKGKESITERGTISSNLKDALFEDFSSEELEQLDIYLTRISETISSEAFQTKLNDIFGNDKRWERFGKMPTHFGKAREQMLERGRYEDHPRHSRNFHGHSGKHYHDHFFEKGTR